MTADEDGIPDTVALRRFRISSTSTRAVEIGETPTEGMKVNRAAHDKYANKRR